MPRECHKTLCLSTYSITFILGIPTNVVALYTFYKKVRQKPTPTNILLLNVTIPGLLFFIFVPLRCKR